MSLEWHKSSMSLQG